MKVQSQGMQCVGDRIILLYAIHSTHFECILVETPRAGPQMGQQGALVDKGEEEGQVACVLAVAHLAKEV